MHATLAVVLANEGGTMFTRGADMKAVNVAEYFIQKASNPNNKGERRILTPLKLQKILYFAQGWYLGNTSRSLFKEKVWAWKYGPVVREVYDCYKRYGDSNLATQKFTFSSQPTDDEKEFLDLLWEKYGNETAENLVTATHNSEPWLDAFSNPYSKEITQSSMRRYFETLF